MCPILYIIITTLILLSTNATCLFPSISYEIEDNSIDPYAYLSKDSYADAVQRALNECRRKFKWDRWNCPKSDFQNIINRDPSPNNKEMAFARAMIASSMVLTIIQNCTADLNGRFPISVKNGAKPRGTDEAPQWKMAQSYSSPANIETQNSRDNLTRISCMKMGFKISREYLDDLVPDDSFGRSVILHNYEAGRLAVTHTMKEHCKCHGVSGSCTTRTCWKQAAKISKIGDYLRKQYRLAAKLDAYSLPVPNVPTLSQQLDKLDKSKLAFIDSSPDYCYENKALGIAGTLNRNCSRTTVDENGVEVSRSEKNSCERLCTECGYKVYTQKTLVEKACQCRFKFCCSVECLQCQREEEVHRCVRY